MVGAGESSSCSFETIVVCKGTSSSLVPDRVALTTTSAKPSLELLSSAKTAEQPNSKQEMPNGTLEMIIDLVLEV